MNGGTVDIGRTFFGDTFFESTNPTNNNDL